MCYAALPALGYATMIAAGSVLFVRTEAGCGVLALAMGGLLLVGIRNAWDITVFAMIRRRG